MRAEWTWLVSMAADNDLVVNARENLSAMEVADTASVRVVAQLDDGGVTHRLALGDKQRTQLASLQNVNSGDPAVLVDFLAWGKKQFPAPHYVVDLWSHGSGWLDFESWAVAEKRPVNINGGINSLSGLPGSLFQEIIDVALGLKSIHLDVSSHDFLTNREMAAALNDAKGKDGKFAVIGCDACLMAMVEVAHQIRDSGTVMVATQDNLNKRGWPYKAILKRFTNGLGAEEVGTIIVEESRNAAEPDTSIAAIRLEKMDSVAEALESLGRALALAMADIDAWMPSISRARNRVQTFSNVSYVDLRHFAELLKIELAVDHGGDAALPAITSAADAVIAALDSAIIAPALTAVTGNTFGLSIYLPVRRIDKSNGYDGLSLSKAAPGWNEFVTTYATNHP